MNNLTFNRFYPSWNLTSLSRKIYMLKSILLEFTLCKIGLHIYQGLAIGNNKWSEGCYCEYCGHLNPNYGKIHSY